MVVRSIGVALLVRKGGEMQFLTKLSTVRERSLFTAGGGTNLKTVYQQYYSCH